MQQIYLKRLTKQDITRSVAICTESVNSFWGVSLDATEEYIPIKICHEDNPVSFPSDITIHKGYQGEKDWRICGDSWKPLYKHQDPSEGDIMRVKKNKDTYAVKIIKRGTTEFDYLSQLFVGKDNYVMVYSGDRFGDNEDDIVDCLKFASTQRAEEVYNKLKTFSHYSNK